MGMIIALAGLVFFIVAFFALFLPREFSLMKRLFRFLKYAAAGLVLLVVGALVNNALMTDEERIAAKERSEENRQQREKEDQARKQAKAEREAEKLEREKALAIRDAMQESGPSDSDKQAIEERKAEREREKKEQEKIAEEKRIQALREKIAKEQQADDEEYNKNRKGFHCLSAWDGSQPDVIRVIKKRLNDPSSFDHESTAVAPIAS